jgi:asparagine synthetase B (glutamine-hydrolysing)
MCGIFGIVLKENTKHGSPAIRSMIDRLFVLSEFRGKEAAGICIKNNQLREIGVVRKSCRAKKFIKSKEYKKLIYNYLNQENIKNGISILGHTRIATNGYVSFDNQPIIKDKTLGVHNGIICNIEELWDQYAALNRKQVTDTELLVGLARQRLDENRGKNISSILFDINEEIEGTASFGLLFDRYDAMVVGSNCGSFYYFNSDEIFAFASEEFILSHALGELFPEPGPALQIRQMEPVSFAIVKEKENHVTVLTCRNQISIINHQIPFTIKDWTVEKPPVPFFNTQPESYIRSKLEYNTNAIGNIRRCRRCILPETHPFIEFDADGVCNYCKDYNRRRKVLLPKGRDLLEDILTPIRKKQGRNCILLLSGGRDSCYALHLAKTELGLNPIAYSYDWGMLTDLGRRNQSRMCEKLGIEHLWVSADIKLKRRNIRLNVEAFLRNPHLGMIGLFMAGDKAYHHFAHLLEKRFNLPLIGSGSTYEHTFFKEGFIGAKPSFMKRTFKDRLQIVSFFAAQALKNPSYVNASIIDNLLAFKYYFVDVLNVTNLFQYLPWVEEEINETLINDYNWELSQDTPTTWRIGDGTAAFYNYIYCTVAGFTENDCFRSNQINEGIMTREEALQLVMKENAPRYESLKWYCDTIGVDLEYAIDRINKIPKLYDLN